MSTNAYQKYLSTVIATEVSKETVATITKKYDAPQHSCPYILIDAWE